jgi:hypothetical protein
VKKKSYLSLAAAVISISGATAGFAAELPTYEAKGFPISPVQVSVLGAANVREQSPVATSPASAQRPGVLKAAAVAPARTTGLSTR